MEYQYDEYNVYNLGNKFEPMMPTDGWYITAPSTRARDYPDYLEKKKKTGLNLESRLYSTEDICLLTFHTLAGLYLNFLEI
jgi:hypothetical protein